MTTGTAKKKKQGAQVKRRRLKQHGSPTMNNEGNEAENMNDVIDMSINDTVLRGKGSSRIRTTMTPNEARKLNDYVTTMKRPVTPGELAIAWGLSLRSTDELLLQAVDDGYLKALSPTEVRQFGKHPDTVLFVQADGWLSLRSLYSTAEDDNAKRCPNAV